MLKKLITFTAVLSLALTLASCGDTDENNIVDTEVATEAPASALVESTTVLYRYSMVRDNVMYDSATLSLDTDSGEFAFKCSATYQNAITGSYDEAGGKLTLTDKKTGEKYVFERGNDKYVFVASESAELPSFFYVEGEEPEPCIPDGAEFYRSDF